MRRSAANVLGWLRPRTPEIAVFLLGVFLRMTMRWNYDPLWSYDSNEHWEVVQWIARYWRVPSPSEILEAQHPPLYYACAAGLLRFGATRASAVWLPIACGTIRLGLIWAGLEMYLPRFRWARWSGLALAAVLPASILIDGMNYPEAMSGMWITAVMLLIPLGFRSSARWRMAFAIGFLLALAMLTKISALVIIASLGVAALVEFLLSRHDWRTRCTNLLSWATAVVVCIALTGWYFARNVREYHRPFVTTFELSQHWLVVEWEKIPYLKRRSPGFLVGWDSSVFGFPYYPSGLREQPRFFPVVVASTFVDYWNYSFSAIDPSDPSPIRVGSNRPLTPPVLTVSRFASIGGTVISLGTAIAWCAAVLHVFRRRQMGSLALLLIPAATVLAAIHFAIKYPVDHYGVIKGVYMQFGAPPMYGLFGLAVAWAQRKPMRWPLMGAFLLALWFVASYSLYCRARVPMLPLG